MKPNHLIIAGITTTIVLGGLGYWGYETYILSENLATTQSELASTTARAVDLESRLIFEIQERESLLSVLTDAEKKNYELERSQRRSERKIDTLTKLTTIDPELLKKYSKIYFLNENYSPPKLEDINEEYRQIPDRNLQILKDVEPYLHKLLRDAEKAGVDLKVLSAYRSFTSQMSLKSQYAVTYGAGANAFSADQGYSEHQLGTTVDFTTPAIGGAYTSFDQTTAFKWLTENAHEYGFVLSYPKNNTYYTYEPWHWRFVGEDLADDLYDDKKNFYDLDQRDIDDYLIKIFE